jgi:hypothetical protein
VWIIPNNSQFYRFVQATEVSNSDWPEHWKTLCESLLWRSKPTRWRTWSQRLKKVNWLSKLCTRICEPSRQYDFVDALTTSLRVTRVNRLALQGSDKVQTTIDTFGRILRESSRQLDLFGASSRTSPDTLASDSPKFIAAYEIWVTQLRRDCLQRQKSALRTNDSGCLSWPTPKEHDVRPESLESHYARKENAKGGMSELAIEVQKVKAWPTPQAHEPRLGYQKRKDGKGQQSLTTIVIDNVGRPAPDSPSTNGKSRELLWPTPSKGSDEGGQGIGLAGGSGNRHKLQQIMGKDITGKLNPAWVAQLMGLQPEWISLGSWATESSLPKQKEPSGSCC